MALVRGTVPMPQMSGKGEKEKFSGSYEPEAPQALSPAAPAPTRWSVHDKRGTFEAVAARLNVILNSRIEW